MCAPVDCLSVGVGEFVIKFVYAGGSYLLCTLVCAFGMMVWSLWDSCDQGVCAGERHLLCTFACASVTKT